MLVGQLDEFGLDGERRDGGDRLALGDRGELDRGCGLGASDGGGGANELHREDHAFAVVLAGAQDLSEPNEPVGDLAAIDANLCSDSVSRDRPEPSSRAVDAYAFVCRFERPPRIYVNRRGCDRGQRIDPGDDATRTSGGCERLLGRG